MKCYYTRLTAFLVAACASGLTAQSTYDVRLSLNNMDCKNAKLAVNVEVKATRADQPFHMGDANYRFAYNANQINAPKILSQDNFSSQAAAPDRNYGAHNLQGSREASKQGIVSLNTFYTASNAGAKMVVGEWQSVAKVGFDLQDFRQLLELKWHSDKMFPITGMNQVRITEADPTAFEYDLRDIKSSGVFNNLTISPASLCPSKSPVVAATPIKTKMNKAISVVFPIYDADENEAHSVKIISVGKGQAAPSVNGLNLNMTYTPTQDYIGSDAVVLEVTDKFGNTERVTVAVTVSSDALSFKNGISPNDDGINDVFVIEGLDKFKESTLSIFDQFGKELYAAKNYKNDWDAQYNGKNLPNGTYYYVLDAGKTETYTGYIQVAR